MNLLNISSYGLNILLLTKLFFNTKNNTKATEHKTYDKAKSDQRAKEIWENFEKEHNYFKTRWH